MSYTSAVQQSLSAIRLEDDHFMDRLMEVMQRFRPFSEAMTAFIQKQGYGGDAADAKQKTAFLRNAFEKAGMTAPREIREWFEADQPIKRETAFQICFAFGLDGSGTDEFFQRFYARERSFNCHLLQEAVYYFCLNNGLSYAEAQQMLQQLQAAPLIHQKGSTVYTGSIIMILNQMESKEELMAYLSEHLDQFTRDNVTSYETICRLWQQATGPEGLLRQEQRLFPSDPEDMFVAETRESAPLRLWDAYLAILKLEKQSVQKLDTDRSIKPILSRLNSALQDSFPDRQGIDRILRGEHVSYERVRKWLVLLAFYTFWASKAVNTHSYGAASGDAERCITRMNHFLMDAGYPELYVGNPYDWLFFYCVKNEEPLFAFRYMFNELLTISVEKDV